ncbi:phenylalanine--tRNA ligase subunit beta [Cellulomonas sp. PhB143]|uniref:phenylalanine--tRNA ligase subunit beta n=1 Tax=Cellulomonas sp. PhB143 TaxID=2485186 RepID=UPI000F466C5A|nr:phenylalanine--tRNA ligase subunit beta [Cellulomonas sp. PhB143]ROS77249.1 phenylalanyl-tRNA synthetase beta subunit [Cellulomonas sp. PhB143]
MPHVVLDWLAEHVELPAGLTAEQLAADLVRVGLEEEQVHAAAVTGPLVVGRVLELVAEPQKNGKTINWCQVDVGAHNLPSDDGSGAPGTPRGIVCGAHNFGVGDLVVVALPGTVLPGPFAIAARKTYGHVSDGMICSTTELGLGEESDGIVVLGRDLLAGEADDVVPGQDAVALLGLGDETLEINVTPDRGYCFSYRGVAREYAHSTGARFSDRGLAAAEGAEPADGVRVPGATPDGFPVTVHDDAPVRGVVGCDRFVTRVVRGIDPAAASPAWMQRRLTQAGMRPLSLTVDVTNYVMLDLGQPLHAYDLARVAEPVVVRRARPGERLTTLDGVDRTLDAEDLLITDSPDTPDAPDAADGSRILGLAGVMGGASSEVTATTTDVLVEAAHFDPVTVARTARRHKLPSEAAKRFERGVDPRLPGVAAQRVVDLLVELGGGTADDAVSDLDRVPAPEPILLRVGEAERLVGVAYPEARVRELLETVGCTVADTPAIGVVSVLPPSWRPDLTGPAELVEEIARLDGYDAIPSTLPPAPAGRGLTRAQRLRRSVARGLAEAGFVQTLSYPFVDPAQHDALGLPADDVRRHALRLANPLAADRPEMRTDLLTTVLDTVRRNVGRGTEDVAVFEIGLVTLPAPGAPAAPQLPGAQRPSDDDLARLAAAVPDQPRRVAGVATGRREPRGWWGPGRGADWSDALAAARLVADRVGVEVVVRADAQHAPWHPGRCARLSLADGTLVGHAGELHPKVLETLGLPARSVAFEVDLDVLLGAVPDEAFMASEVSTFPHAKEDLALVVDADVPAQSVRDALVAGAGDLLEDVRLFDVFTGEQVGEGKKSLAFALRLRGADRTLTAEDVVRVRDAAVAAAAERTGATLRA